METEAEAGEEWVLRRVAEEITCPMCVNLPRNRVQWLHQQAAIELLVAEMSALSELHNPPNNRHRQPSQQDSC